MTTRRDVPTLVEAAAYCLAYHRNNRCWKCSPSGWCPLANVARARILAWHRYRILRRR